jgi:hypothetical protein
MRGEGAFGFPPSERPRSYTQGVQTTRPYPSEPVSASQAVAEGEINWRG